MQYRVVGEVELCLHTGWGGLAELRERMLDVRERRAVPAP